MQVVQAGDLDRRITIQRATAGAASAYNEPQPQWNDLATVWARRQDASDGEAFRALEVGAEISARFLVRYSTLMASVSPLDRIDMGGRIYNITGVKEPAGTRNQWIEITAVARADHAAHV